MSAAGADGGNFASRLIAWQSVHGRHDLPWQHTRDAYRIWLSEVMLQQTQVGTVIPYYTRFLERYPEIGDLAAAPLATVLEAWAGLGYYARARNLHRCAQAIVAAHGGRFPAQAETLATLPGIGRSTAAAIAVFAFGARAAILDGNVKRVLARCFGIGGGPGQTKTERAMWQLAESLLPTAGIEAYTQGLMDLGSGTCTRNKPRCTECPLAGSCVARRENRQADLPVRRARKALPERECTMLLLTDGRRVLLERRPPTGIWGGLLALPEAGNNAIEACVGRFGCGLLAVQSLPPVRQSFTHFRLTIHPLVCSVEANARGCAEPGWEWRDLDNLASAALPAPVARLLATMPTGKPTETGR